jgi:hypothetical protein
MLKTFFEINEIFLKTIEKVENFEGLQAVKFERLIAKKLAVLFCDRIKKLGIGSAKILAIKSYIFMMGSAVDL